jgi:hypothetical protein
LSFYKLLTPSEILQVFMGRTIGTLTTTRTRTIEI